MKYAITLFVFLALQSSSVGANDHLLQCDPTMFVDSSKIHFKHDETLAYLNTITQANWNEAKHQLQAGIALPLEVPLTADEKFSDYSKWWENYKNEKKYFRHASDDQTLISTVVSKNNAEDYRACLEASSGLSVNGVLNGNDVVINVAWHPAPATKGQHIPQSIIVHIEPTGAQAARAEDIKIGINGSTEKTYHLQPGVPFELVASSNGETAHVNALIPKVYTCTIKTEPTVLVNQYNMTDKSNRGEDAMKNWGNAVWKPQLEAQHHKNVTVTYTGTTEDPPRHVGPRIGGYFVHDYHAHFRAEMDGSSTYGPDPRCTADEPNPVEASATKQ